MSSPSPSPRRQEALIFEVTQRCNHDCLHCYNVWKNRAPYPAGELPTAETLEILAKLLDDNGARLVSLSGGEPLLRQDLPEIVTFLNARGAAANLITNGSLLDDGILRQLLPDRISIFELPLLADSAELHDRMSGARVLSPGLHWPWPA